MGEVYLATDTTAGRKAALKLLPMRFTADAERLTRFQQEAHAVVALNHPNILTIYEIGEDHSAHYIASELIEGETLRQRLARGRMDLSEAVDIAIQVASALAAAHEAGIVHRDIKPENIMLRPDAYVKVLDFGIAKLAEPQAATTMPTDETLLLADTSMGAILGTVPYMSPEQLRGAAVDKRTDIWGLGVLLYEMVTEHQPFTGKTPRQVMTSILEKEPSPLTSHNKRTPLELQQVISKALRKGSVRRSGDQVRVSVQLIDARNDRHLWAENYDRKVADSVSLQGEVATEIANAVGAKLSPEEKARVEATPTNNPAAYDAYLRARAIPVDWGFAVEGHIKSAVRLYEQAVNLDPNFTLAWPYLSIAHIQSLWKGLYPELGQAAQTKTRAEDSLNHALTLDPNLPEVHLARGYNERDDTRALAEFRQAENGLPNSVDVIEAIARRQRALGHWDDAVAELRRGIELDPRNISAANNLALTYCAMRRFSEALATLDRALAWDPTNARALLTKADALLAIGDLQTAEPLLANPNLPANRRATFAMYQRNYAAAIEILSRDLAVDRQQRDSQDILSLAFNQQLAGDTTVARATYQKSIEDFRRQLEKAAQNPYIEADMRINLGKAYAGLGEAASAIAEGNKAMALVPTSNDLEFGSDLEDEMARIYARLGDADHAIPMLKRLLRTSYPSATSLTPATLRLDPIWDPIRNDPRFQELVQER